VVIQVVRNSRAASVVTETMAGLRPSIWVSDFLGAPLAVSGRSVWRTGNAIAKTPSRQCASTTGV
jgi:hypothetical protein